MHRKFIALILATAMAITGLSAAPARADGDTARIFAGLALLAIISETTSPAPKRWTIFRKGSSVIPDIGARKTGFSRRMGPMEMHII